MNLNTVGMAGTVAEAPERHRNIYGQENVYALWLDITRDSGNIDRVLVLFQEDKVDGGTYMAEEPESLAALITKGSRIEITGAIQTYKNTYTGRIQLFVWARYLAAIPESSQQLNVAYIKGEIAKQPVYRETPKGRRITDISVRIPSVFREGFYSYIPCIVWEGLAAKAAELPEGTAVYLEGRIQSRDYMKHTEDDDQVLTTWEVSVCKLEEGNQSNGN